MLKYKIKECLNKLTVNEYRILIKAVPDYLGRSINTFWNYVNIEASSKLDIPHCTVIKLEMLFSLKPGELINIQVEGKRCTEVINDFKRSYRNKWNHLRDLEDRDG
jgi:hypothetical protein